MARRAAGKPNPGPAPKPKPSPGPKVEVSGEALDRLIVSLGRRRTRTVEGGAVVSTVMALFGLTHTEASAKYAEMNERVEAKGKVSDAA